MVNNKNTQSFLKSKQCQGQDTGIKQYSWNRYSFGSEMENITPLLFQVLKT